MLTARSGAHPAPFLRGGHPQGVPAVRKRSGRSAARLAHLHGVQGVTCSNHVAPTILKEAEEPSAHAEGSLFFYWSLGGVVGVAAGLEFWVGVGGLGLA